MNVNCPSCNAQYSIQRDRIPVTGLEMRCSQCMTTFQVAGSSAPPRATGAGLPTSPQTQGNAVGQVFVQRAGGQTVGPLTEAQVAEMLKTGNLGPNDGVSYDQRQWRPISAVPRLAAHLPGPQGGSTRAVGRPVHDAPYQGGGFSVPAGVGSSDAGDDGSMPGLVSFEFEGGTPSTGYDFSNEPGEASGFYLDESVPLPTPARQPGFDAELPAPAGFDAELPAPALGFDAELPAPAGFGAELPAPVGGFDAELPAPVSGFDAELPASAGYHAELPAPVGGFDAELPAPAGFDAELPAPAGYDAELPQSAGYDAELPLSAGFDAELPMSTGFDAELPMPSAAEMPMSSQGELPRPQDAALPSPGDSQLPQYTDALEPVDSGADPWSVDGSTGFDRSTGFGHDDFTDGSGTGFVAPEGEYKSAFEAPAEPSGGVDMARFDDAFKDSTSAARAVPDLETGDVLDTDLPVPDRKKAEAKKPKKPKKAKKSSIPLLLLGVVALFFVLVAGVAGAWTLGVFDGLLSDDGGDTTATNIEEIKISSASKGLDTLRPDTHKAFQDYFSAVEGEKANPSRRGQIAVANTLYIAHYPHEKGRVEKLKAATKGLKGDGEYIKLGRGALAVHNGDEALADELLEPIATDGDKKSNRYTAHLLLGLVDLMATRNNGGGEVLEVDEESDEKPTEPGDDEKDARFKKSLSHLEEAAKLDPEAPAPVFFKGLLYTQKADYEKAAEAFDEVLKNHEDHVPSIIERANVAYLAGDLDKAKEQAAKLKDAKFRQTAHVRERSRGYLVLGQVEVAARNSDEAIKALDQAIRLDTSNVEALKELGREFFRKRRFEEALNFFESNPKLKKSDPEVMLMIVKCLIGLERFDKALKTLKGGAKRFGDDPRFPYWIGRIEEREGNWLEARKNFEQALKVDDTFPPAHVRMAMLLLRDDKKEEARAYLRKAERNGAANDADISVDLAGAYLIVGEEKKALAILERTLQRNKANVDARIQLAQFYLEKGDANKAVEVVKPLEGKTDDDIVLMRLLADIYQGLGEYEKSIQNLDKLVAESPKNAEYRFKLGRAYLGLRNYETALEAFLKAYQLKPTYYDAYFYAGRVYLEQEKYKQAIKIFRLVLDEDRTSGEYRYYLGLALEKSGNTTQALEEYSLIDRYDPTYPTQNIDLRFRRGGLLLRKGQYRDAKKDLTAVLKANPNHVGALMKLGDTLFDEKEYKAAIKLYEKAVSVNDALPEAYLKLGRAFNFTGNKNDAIDNYEKAIRLGLPDPSAHETLAFLYKGQGNKGKAVHHFKKYLELKPKAANKREIKDEIRRLGG